MTAVGEDELKPGHTVSPWAQRCVHTSPDKPRQVLPPRRAQGTARPSQSTADVTLEQSGTDPENMCVSFTPVPHADSHVGTEPSSLCFSPSLAPWPPRNTADEERQTLLQAPGTTSYCSFTWKLSDLCITWSDW